MNTEAFDTPIEEIQQENPGDWSSWIDGGWAQF